MNKSTITISHEAQQTRIHIAGRFDFQLSKVFLDFLQTIDLKNDFVVDFNDCDYMDSAGLGCLLKLQQLLSESEYRLSFSGANPKINKAMAMMQLV